MYCLNICLYQIGIDRPFSSSLTLLFVTMKSVRKASFMRIFDIEGQTSKTKKCCFDKGSCSHHEMSLAPLALSGLAANAQKGPLVDEVIREVNDEIIYDDAPMRERSNTS
jgi:hypothetical protein